MPTLRSLLKKLESPSQRILRLTAEGKTQKVKDMLATDKGRAVMNARDAQGRTPFFLAVINGNFPLAKALVEAGARPDIPTYAVETPLDTLLDAESLTLGQLSILHYFVVERRPRLLPLRYVANRIQDEEVKDYYRRLADEEERRADEDAGVGNPEAVPEPEEDEDPRGGRRKKTARKTRRRRTRRRR